MHATTDRMIEEMRSKVARIKTLFSYLEDGPGWMGMGKDAGLTKKTVARECRELGRMVAKLERRAINKK